MAVQRKIVSNARPLGMPTTEGHDYMPDEQHIHVDERCLGDLFRRHEAGTELYGLAIWIEGPFSNG